MSQAKSPHVCFIIVSVSAIGGAERQLLQLFANRPEYLRHKLSLITLVPEDEDYRAPFFEDLGIEHIVVPRMQMSQPAFVLRLMMILRRLKPDIVHTFMTGTAGNWGRLVAWFMRVPHIFHSDRMMNPPIKQSRNTLRPFLDARTDHFFPNAEAIADWLVSMGVDRDKITLNPNGIQLEKFEPDQTPTRRAEWGITDDKVVAGFLARFRPEKRLDLLLDALTSLPLAERPDFIVLGGDGEVMPKIKARVETDAWLKERCLLVGMVKDVPKFMASLDFLILCSDYEGTPNVVIEAMAMARPVIGTRVADVPKLIEGIGYLSDKGDIEGLAQNIRTMTQLSDRERCELGRRGRAKVMSEHDVKPTAEKFWQAHLDALEGPAK